MRNRITTNGSHIVEDVTAAHLGSRVRALRHQQRLTLDEVAARSGVSRAMLSKIERGQNNPTLVVVVKVALGLGVSTSQLITGEERRGVFLTPRDRRMVFRDAQTGFERELLFPPFEGASLEFVRHVLPQGVNSGTMPAHRRGADKYIVVERGTLRVVIQSNEYLVHEGDTLYFECDVAHGFENAGECTCSYFIVISAHAP
jgi:transcriptional regulator with XRE-family HTH domain